MENIYETLAEKDEYAFWLLYKAIERAGASITKGSRVQMTEWGKAQLGPKPNQTTGTCVGYGRDLEHIWVLVDGKKQKYSYWAGFWRPAQNAGR